MNMPKYVDSKEVTPPNYHSEYYRTTNELNAEGWHDCLIKRAYLFENIEQISKETDAEKRNSIYQNEICMMSGSDDLETAFKRMNPSPSAEEYFSAYKAKSKQESDAILDLASETDFKSEVMDDLLLEVELDSKPETATVSEIRAAIKAQKIDFGMFKFMPYTESLTSTKEIISFQKLNGNYFKPQDDGFHTNENLANYCHIAVIDISLPDKVLKKDFELWLAHARSLVSKPAKKPTMRADLFTSWHKKKILQYMDVYVWHKLHGMSVTAEVFSEILFHNDHLEDKVDAFKTTVRLAKESLSTSGIASLNAEIQRKSQQGE